MKQWTELIRQLTKRITNSCFLSFRFLANLMADVKKLANTWYLQHSEAWQWQQIQRLRRRTELWTKRHAGEVTLESQDQELPSRVMELYWSSGHRSQLLKHWERWWDKKWDNGDGDWTDGEWGTTWFIAFFRFRWCSSLSVDPCGKFGPLNWNFIICFIFFLPVWKLWLMDVKDLSDP